MVNSIKRHFIRQVFWSLLECTQRLKLLSLQILSIKGEKKLTYNKKFNLEYGYWTCNMYMQNNPEINLKVFKIYILLNCVETVTVDGEWSKCIFPSLCETIWLAI